MSDCCSPNLCAQTKSVQQSTAAVTPNEWALFIDPTLPCNQALSLKKLPIENEVLKGPAAPTAPPAEPTENKTWFNTTTSTITHYWDSTAQAWIEVKPLPDVFRVVQPLVAGNNTITDNLGSTARVVDVRDNVTGEIISARVVSEAANSFVLFVPVAPLNPSRISSDV
jgi:hypothetical protein